MINLTTDFSRFPVLLEEKWFYAEVFVLFLYWILLLRAYIRVRQNEIR